MANDFSDATRLERTLAKTTAAAFAVSRMEGPHVLGELARRLAEILEVDATMIGRLDEPGRVTAVATCLNGRLLGTFQYDLEGTPCRAMLDRESRFVAQGVRDEFAPGSLFHAQGFESYAAHSLVDGQGTQIGLIVAMHRQPMADPALTETLLQLFAVRASVELERSRADEAARASEASYRAIFDATEDSIFVHDIDTGCIVDVNPKACRTYGYTHDELLGVRIADVSFNEPPYTEADAARYMERARNGEPVRFEWRRRNKDGSLHWDEVVLKRATLGGRERVLAFTREITDRKDAHEALRLREEQYRAIFEGSADALVLWSRDVRIVDVNAAFTAIYGYTREEIIGSTFGDRLPTLDVARRIRMMQRALEGEKGILETRTIRKSGEAFDVEIRYLPIRHRGEPHVLAIARDITERKRAEEALRASETRYRTLFEMESATVVLVDVETLKLVDVNIAAVQMYGYTREELLRMAATDLSAEPEATAPSIREGQGALNIPLRWHRRKDGSAFPVEITANRVELDGRRIVLATVRDITERMRGEQALRDSEEQYRAIFNASADALVLRDADFRIVDVNATYEAMSGYSRDEVIGLDRVIANPPEVASAIRALHSQALAGEPIHFETPFLRRDGARYELELRGVPILHRGARHVLYIGRDITQRKRAETDLARSEERYRAIFNASEDALVLWNSQLVRVDVNAAHERMFGYSRDETLGTIGLPGLSDAETDERRERVRRTLAGERLRVEMESVRRSGERFPIEVRTLPIEHGGEPHVLAVVRDITERKEAEARRAELESQLRQAQKMEAIGHLTGGIAHDFNNILTSVMGYLVLASERPAAGSDRKLQSHLEQAEQSCHRARELIQQMLAFSRGQRGEPRPVALRSLLGDSTRMLRATLPATVELVTRVAGDPVARVDPVQAHQVLLNLCINARDAMDEAGRIVASAKRVRLPETTCASCRRLFSGEFAELAVADSGSGIAPEVVERMFDPFFSTKETGQGTGMGLSIVHGVVHEHGGHILVESRPGAGTTFRVLLPLAPDDEPGAEPSEKRGKGRRTPLRGRVLLVEDEQSVLGFMRELLQGWGLAVVAARDPADALRWFSMEPDRFDVVITDHTMPGMTGLEVARALIARRPDLPVLLYSGRSELLDPEVVASAGVRRMLSKPIDVPALHEELRALLASDAGA